LGRLRADEPGALRGARLRCCGFGRSWRPVSGERRKNLLAADSARRRGSFRRVRGRLRHAVARRAAIDWVKRCPNPHDEQCEIEIRPVFEASDFGEALTPELRAQEDRITADAKRNAGA
jgi:hypothetical protein